jgi:hypothetical protein
MKITIICILLYTFNVCAFAQGSDTTTILLVGTMHKLPGAFKGNYKYIKKRVIQFKPEIVCSEYIIPTDSVSLKKYYGQNFIRRYDSTLRAEHVAMMNVQDKIDSLQLLLNSEDSEETRYLLSKQYYYQKDFGNMDFQNYILLRNRKNSNLSKAERAEILKRYARLKNNEYDLIAFPYCHKNKISYLFPIDDHSFETEYNESTKKWKNESNGELNKQQQAYFSKYKRKLIWSFFVGKGGKVVNSLEGQNFCRKLESNLFDSTISENYNNASEFWEKRNENMAKNISSIARINRNEPPTKSSFQK